MAKRKNKEIKLKLNRGKKINWIVFLSCLIAVYFFAVLGSMLTSKEINSGWYDSIRPSLAPPNWVFPVVWTLLFYMIAVALYFSWFNLKNKKKVIGFYLVNLVLNTAWSYFFFKLKNPFGALIVLVLLWVSILSLIWLNWKTNRKSSYLLIPYFLWVSFAGILNYMSVQ